MRAESGALERVDLIIRANKILGVSFSFNKQIENDEIFVKHNIEKGLHL